MKDSGTLNAGTLDPQIVIRSGGYTQYPFHPHEAFRGIGPIVELDEGTEDPDEPTTAAVGESSEGNNGSNDADAIEEVPAVSGKYPTPTPMELHSQQTPATTPPPPEPYLETEKEALDLSGLEVLGISVGSTSYDPSTYHLQVASDTTDGSSRPLLGITIDTTPSFPPEAEEDNPISPLRSPLSPLRRLVSHRRSSSSSLSPRPSLRNSIRSQLSSRSSHTLRSQPSTRSSYTLRSSPSSRSTLSRRFSLSRSIRRPRDLELGLPELDSGAPIGPFELSSLSVLERQEISSRTTARQQRRKEVTIIETLFGPALCAPQYQGLRRAYMAQLDTRLEAEVKIGGVENPNSAIWPTPREYLVGFLATVAGEMKTGSTVTGFLWGNMDGFLSMLRGGDFNAPTGEEQVAEIIGDREKAAIASSMGMGGEYTPWHQKVLYSWMLFSLESWMMLDFRDLVEFPSDIPASLGFCDASLGELIRSKVPTKQSGVHHQTTTLTPTEITAGMLYDWKGMRFIWTSEIGDHLKMDSRQKTIMLYDNVAFAMLHSIANDGSSISKAGCVNYHQLLTEVAESYRLLFGSDRRSMAYFRELGQTRAGGNGSSGDGYFDITTLQGHEYEPRFLYNINSDFPVFGDRLLMLKKLCVPTGIVGLWRDRRDSLQWYTFWAVVFLGCFGAMMAFLQLGLGAVQTWATVAAMNTSSGPRGSGG
jgi:hypothetical protein